MGNDCKTDDFEDSELIGDYKESYVEKEKPIESVIADYRDEIKKAKKESDNLTRTLITQKIIAEAKHEEEPKDEDEDDDEDEDKDDDSDESSSSFNVFSVIKFLVFLTPIIGGLFMTGILDFGDSNETTSIETNETLDSIVELHDTALRFIPIFVIVAIGGMLIAMVSVFTTRL